MLFRVRSQWKLLEKSFDGKRVTLEKLKLFETEGSSCEVNRG